MKRNELTGSVDRRAFLKISVRLSALMGLSTCSIPRVAEALAEMTQGNATVLWLQGQSCSGCSISLLSGETPTPVKLITQYISLAFHQTLSTATGHVAVETLNKSIAQGGYILAVEGAVPAGMPRACLNGEETFPDQLMRAARNAKAVLAVGSCAAFGGVPAAEHNPTGAISVPKFLASAGIQTPKILIPGCPAHPDWLLGTVVHVLKFGLPPLDAAGRPKAFYSKLIHDQCPRFADYEREKFARTFGEEGCLFKLGCLGPITHADCTVRHWNGGVNTCINAGAPCIGCAGEQFVARTNFPLLPKDLKVAARDHE
ncbi:MAG: hydrogenase small subunit [Verrucomicrobia bacterium]|nr:hydrogenase small subunit [Verrucomicrobiota bacterium]